MPETKKGIKTKQFDDLGKGVNLFARDTMIADNECVDGWNCWSVGKNSVAKRPGVVKFAEVAGASMVDGLGTHYDGTTRTLLAMAGGALKDITTGSAVAISAAPASAGTFTAGKRTDFCQAMGRTYISNGTQVLRYFDGDTIREQTGGVIGKWMIYYKLSLWLGGNPTAGNYTKLYRSGTGANIGNFTYDATGNPYATSTEIGSDDGTPLVGVFRHQDYIYPVKERSMWRATQATTGEALISIELIDPARGCDSHHSIDAVENDNFMFNEQGVYATGYEPNIQDQIRTNVISLRIDPKLAAIQKSRLEFVEGIFYDNHYYLAFTSGGGTYNDTFLVYDRQRLGWWEFQVADDSGNYIGASCFSEWKNGSGETELYFGSPTDGSVYYFDDTVESDPGYSIASQYITKKYPLGKEYSQSKFFLDTLVYMGRTPGDVTFDVYVDGTLAKTKTVAVGNTGFAGEGISPIGDDIIGLGGGSMEIVDSGGGDFVRIPINKIGRNIHIKVSDNGTKSWEINSFNFNYKPLNNLFQPKVR